MDTALRASEHLEGCNGNRESVWSRPSDGKWEERSVPIEPLPMNPGSLLSWLLVGLLAGWLAGLLTRGRGFGCLGNIAVGLLGAIVGGYLFTLLGFRGPTGFIGSVVIACIGAAALLVVLNLAARPR